MAGWPLGSPARFHENSAVSTGGIAGASRNAPRHRGMPLSSRTPSLTSSGILILVTNIAADEGQKPATRRPSFFATGNAHAMFTSATIHVTSLPPPPAADALALILPTSFSSSLGMANKSDSVSRPRSLRSSPWPSPSDMDTMSTPPSSPPWLASSKAPRMRPWLTSVLTKVTLTPCSTRQWASSIRGMTWPWAGKGKANT
ncbi:Os03g0757132 [Oryza sativa Japonica Group]|uniref:Os03g0757132 protein n=1 Tax=Oryza sativa subsp. japonica TaxID=39947 RepID=A0A0P0W3S7_ORYSJ|nr:Os03g0757132 [Oryza sativa Japonica Group]